MTSHNARLLALASTLISVALSPARAEEKPASAAKASSPSTKTSASAAKTVAKTYKAPEFFDGEENGKPSGNPLETGGKPLWRFDQIWPDDPLKRENYKPMNWAGNNWRGAYEFGGQPEAKVEAGKIQLGVRGGWGGDGSMPGNKMVALVFIAPAKGTYTVMGTARAGVWQGDKAAASLSVLKADTKANKITRVRSIATPSDTDVALEEIEVEMEAGQELLFVPMVTQMYTAANLELRDLKIQTGGESGAKALAVGQSVTLAGRKYTVEKIEGKTVTLVGE
jgi:hypothetical protein